MKEGYFMIRTIRSGKVIEKSQSYVGERKPRAARKKGNSSQRKKDGNLICAIRRLARTLNCNFMKGDLLVTLHYDDAHLPDSLAEADRLCKLFWDRLARALKKLGLRLRGVWITSDLDPETGKVVRIHHHLVIGGEGVALAWEGGKLADATVGARSLRDIWGCGGLDVEPLHEQDDYTPIAVYFLRQVRGWENEKKWHPSRGLKKPVVESERIVSYPRELRAPGGATVKEIGRYDEATGQHYIRYIRKPRPKKEKKIGGHKEPLLYEPQYVETDEMRWGLE